VRHADPTPANDFDPQMRPERILSEIDVKTNFDFRGI
jgi:hypothetical protein